jgi:hypothetical protein
LPVIEEEGLRLAVSGQGGKALADGAQESVLGFGGSNRHQCLHRLQQRQQFGHGPGQHGGIRAGQCLQPFPPGCLQGLGQRQHLGGPLGQQMQKRTIRAVLAILVELGSGKVALLRQQAALRGQHQRRLANARKAGDGHQPGAANLPMGGLLKGLGQLLQRGFASVEPPTGLEAQGHVTPGRREARQCTSLFQGGQTELEILTQRLMALITCLGFLVQAMCHHRSQRREHAGVAPSGQWGRQCQMGMDGAGRVVDGEGRRAGQCLQQGGPEAVEVGAIVHVATHPPGQLRRQRGQRCFDQFSLLDQGAFTINLGRQAQVGHAHTAGNAARPLQQDHLAQPQVAMDEALGMQVLKRVDQVQGDAQQRLGVQWALAQSLPKGLRAGELRRIEQQTGATGVLGQGGRAQDEAGVQALREFEFPTQPGHVGHGRLRGAQQFEQRASPFSHTHTDHFRPSPQVHRSFQHTLSERTFSQRLPFFRHRTARFLLYGL